MAKSKSHSIGATHYRWKKARGKIKLSPLRLRVHELLEKTPAQSLPVDTICKNLTPRMDSPAKRRAVRTALEELTDKKLIESVAAPVAAGTSGVAFAPVSAVAAPITWACPGPPKGAGTALTNRILAFLQDKASAQVKANPNLDVADIWFKLSVIRSGVDSTVPLGRYIAELKGTLKVQGCVAVKDGADEDSFQAIAV